MEKLYYTDSHRKTFESRVTGCHAVSGGWEITLNATAFYPEGGGQPCDTGHLGDSRVLAVKETGEEIVHLCDKALPVGSQVSGAIDWARRFDFMQQHSGEHIVSGIIHALYGYHNVGFHMGAEVVTIDFDGPIAPEALQDIEDRANAAVWQNLPVRCYYPSAEELPGIPYRRKRDLPWPVRLVEIPGIDLCACCGTQVSHTGEVGLIKLLSCVKFHEGVRIEMVCGKRALGLLSDIYEQNRLVSQTFSAKPLETSLAARRASEALVNEKYRAAGLEKQLFSYIAKEYAGKTLAVHIARDLSPAATRELCTRIAQEAEIAVTASGTDKTGYALCIISNCKDAKAIGTATVAALNGRGGGKREAFQGSVNATAEEIKKYFDWVLQNGL